MFLILIVVEVTNKQWKNGSFEPFGTLDGKVGG
jgi:hypothetical protein